MVYARHPGWRHGAGPGVWQSKRSGRTAHRVVRPLGIYALARSGASAASNAWKPCFCRVSVVGTPCVSQPMAA